MAGASGAAWLGQAAPDVLQATLVSGLLWRRAASRRSSLKASVRSGECVPDSCRQRRIVNASLSVRGNVCVHPIRADLRQIERPINTFVFAMHHEWEVGKRGWLVVGTLFASRLRVEEEQPVAATIEF